MSDNTRIHRGKLRNMASVYLRCDDQILLLYRQGASIVSNLWIGSAGGHFETTELNDAKACAIRELREELGICENDLKNLSLRYVTLRYNEGEIRQNYYFFADIDSRTTPVSTEGITQWFRIDQLKDLPMPYTARYMIEHYLSTGQFNDSLYGSIATDAEIKFIKL